MMLHDLRIPGAGSLKYCHPENIIRLQAKGNYTCIYFTGNTKTTVATVLKKYEEILSGYGFLRAHRSHLINRMHIESVTPTGMIIMKDRSIVKMSRRKRMKFIAACNPD